MKHKHFLLAFVALASGENSFYKAIRNTGARRFFEQFFYHISSASEGYLKCAFFDMDGTIISAALISPVFAYQVRNFQFAFKSDMVDEVFGFTTALDECRPTGTMKLELKDSNEMITNVEVNFEELLRRIHSEFHTSLRLKEATEDLGGLIAVWEKFASKYMKEFTPKGECDYLMTTIKIRLLHGYGTDMREYFMKAVLNENDRTQNDFYNYDCVQVSIRTNIPAAYEEQKALISKLIEHKVIPFVISATPKEYLVTLIEHFGIRINSENVNGSYPIPYHSETQDAAVLAGRGHANERAGKRHTMQSIVTKHSCTPIFASGDSMGDYEMVVAVLQYTGYALIQQGNAIHHQLLALETAFEGRVRIQNVNLETAKWQEEAYVRST